jgi:hypothetical protein
MHLCLEVDVRAKKINNLKKNWKNKQKTSKNGEKNY